MTIRHDHLACEMCGAGVGVYPIQYTGIGGARQCTVSRRPAPRPPGAVGPGARRVAAEADIRLLNSCQKVSSTGFARSAHAPSILSCSELRWCTTDLGARAPLKTVCQKLFAVASRPCKTSHAQGTTHSRLALNSGHDGLVLLAGGKRSVATCSAAQRNSFRVLSDLYLYGIDELGFIH